MIRFYSRTAAAILLLEITFVTLFIVSTLASGMEFSRLYKRRNNNRSSTCKNTNRSTVNSSVSLSRFGGGKKGIGFPLRDIGRNGSYVENLPKVMALDVYWNYAWTERRIDQQPDIPMFVPMSWDGGRDPGSFKDRIVHSNVTKFIANGTVQVFLGYNEPDNPKQSNMTVSIALQRWKILQKLDIPLVSPSTVHADNRWMKRFMHRAKERCLRVDYIGVHVYNGPNFDSFVERLTRIYNLHQQLPLVVTELAVVDWYAQNTSNNRFTKASVLNFTKFALPWMERTEWIVGYAWFSFPLSSPYGWISSLFNKRGTLNKLGRYYKSVRTDNIDGDQSI